MNILVKELAKFSFIVIGGNYMIHKALDFYIMYKK
jgi:hypothetical protein